MRCSICGKKGYNARSHPKHGRKSQKGSGVGPSTLYGQDPTSRRTVQQILATPFATRPTTTMTDQQLLQQFQQEMMQDDLDNAVFELEAILKRKDARVIEHLIKNQIRLQNVVYELLQQGYKYATIIQVIAIINKYFREIYPNSGKILRALKLGQQKKMSQKAAFKSIFKNDKTRNAYASQVIKNMLNAGVPLANIIKYAKSIKIGSIVPLLELIGTDQAFQAIRKQQEQIGGNNKRQQALITMIDNYLNENAFEPLQSETEPFAANILRELRRKYSTLALDKLISQILPNKIREINPDKALQLDDGIESIITEFAITEDINVMKSNVQFATELLNRYKTNFKKELQDRELQKQELSIFKQSIMRTDPNNKKLLDEVTKLLQALDRRTALIKASSQILGKVEFETPLTPAQQRQKQRKQKQAAQSKAKQAQQKAKGAASKKLRSLNVTYGETATRDLQQPGTIKFKNQELTAASQQCLKDLSQKPGVFRRAFNSLKGLFN